MTTTKDRIQLLSQALQADAAVRLLGEVHAKDLAAWITAELGHLDALDTFHPHGNLMSKAYAPSHILHIVSGNTAHAAFQTLIRGLLVGAQNTVKLPTSGLPEFENWIDHLAPALHKLVSYDNAYHETQLKEAELVIAIGSDQTIQELRHQVQAHQRFISYGHKVSIGIVTGDFHKAAGLAARDCSLFNQRGCLSPHAIYVQGDVALFAKMMAQEMAHFAGENPPSPLTLSEAGSIQNLRETTRFIAANDKSTQLWHSTDNLDWTVILESTSDLKLSCLNRCVYIKPIPPTLSPKTLGSESAHLSSVTLHPFSTEQAGSIADSLPASRICPMGSAQAPSLFWHHDGYAPLAALVKWKDLG